MCTAVLPGGPPQGASLQTLHCLQAGSPQKLAQQTDTGGKQEDNSLTYSHVSGCFVLLIIREGKWAKVKTNKLKNKNYIRFVC